MVLKYVWLEKESQWKKKGNANNMWLSVNHENKTYSCTVTPYCDISDFGCITVSRKYDIEKIIHEMQVNGYKCES